MSGKKDYLGDFDVPSAIIDDYQWVMDSFIDDTSLGTQCQLIYPPIPSECPNCIIDPASGRSSGKYKSGGPIPFPANTICPWCGSEGSRLEPSTENIRLRTYPSQKDWQNIGMDFKDVAGVVQIIGYMSDLPKVMRAQRLIIYIDLQDLCQWICEVASEGIPWGFGSRYFIMFLKRVGD